MKKFILFLAGLFGRKPEGKKVEIVTVTASPEDEVTPETQTMLDPPENPYHEKLVLDSVQSGTTAFVLTNAGLLKRARVVRKKGAIVGLRTHRGAPLRHVREAVVLAA